MRCFQKVLPIVLTFHAAALQSEDALRVRMIVPLTEASDDTLGGSSGESVSGTIVWNADPYSSYEVRESRDLTDWTTSEGYPKRIEESFGSFDVSADLDARFYQVSRIDDQGPVVVESQPSDGQFAVKRFDSISFSLGDANGIDDSSIVVSVEPHGSFDLSSPEFVRLGNEYVLSLGEGVAWGEYGETVVVSVSAADTLGNRDMRQFNFQLELEPILAEDIFVFGSNEAQIAGQRFAPDSVASVLAERMREGEETPRILSDHSWTLTAVQADRIEITYTNVAPDIEVETYLSNSAPNRPGEVFYRQVVSLSDDVEDKTLTVMTRDADIGELIIQGSVTFGNDSSVLLVEGGEAGVSTFSDNLNFELPRLGYSLDGAKVSVSDEGFVTDTGNSETSTTYGSVDLSSAASLEFEELHFWLYPTIDIGIDISSGGVERFRSVVSGRSESSAIYKFSSHATVIDKKWTVFDLPVAAEPSWWLRGWIGAMPVWVKQSLDFQVKVSTSLEAAVEFRSGGSQRTDMTFGIIYDEQESPAVEWVNDFVSGPFENVPFEGNPSLEFSVALEATPQINSLVNEVAGFSTRLIVPKLGFNFEVSEGREVTGEMESGVDLELEAYGPMFDLLNLYPKVSYPVYGPNTRPIYPRDSELVLSNTPERITAILGRSVELKVSAESLVDIAYAWYHKGRLLPWANSDILSIQDVQVDDLGDYHVELTSGNESLVSPTIELVQGSEPEIDLAPIPAGSFTKGSPESEMGRSPEEAQHVVDLTRGYYMGQTEVTNAQMVKVMNWALERGLVTASSTWGEVRNAEGVSNKLLDLDYGQIRLSGGVLVVDRGKEALPCVEVTWFGAMAYCHYLTRMEEGLGQAVDLSSWSVDFNKSGYRLPTDSEWEHACRAGTETAFYTGEIAEIMDQPIDPNLDSAGWYAGNSELGSQPVGQKQSNPFGLSDMHGNVKEWCYDLNGDITNPDLFRPEWYRSVRGGSWASWSADCRSASRDSEPPSYSSNSIGFRVARTSIP